MGWLEKFEATPNPQEQNSLEQEQAAKKKKNKKGKDKDSISSEDNKAVIFVPSSALFLYPSYSMSQLLFEAALGGVQNNLLTDDLAVLHNKSRAPESYGPHSNLGLASPRFALFLWFFVVECCISGFMLIFFYPLYLLSIVANAS